MFSKTPKISCLMVTAADRFHLVRRSIDCYIYQTYPCRELIIVNEGPKTYQHQIQKYIDSLRRPDIKCCWLDGMGSYTLGALRNISLHLASGDIVVQWDDDDFSMPQRLATQYSFLARHPKAKVCYLTDQLHYYFQANTLYWDSWKKFHSGGTKKFALIPGTLMAHRDLDIRYPSSGKCSRAGEDSVFSDILIRKDEQSVVLLEEMGFMHMYTHHGFNQVYDIEHHIHISRMRSNNREFMLKHRDRIMSSIEFFKLDGPVKVMGQDGLAFIYNRGDKRV